MSTQQLSQPEQNQQVPPPVTSQTGNSNASPLNPQMESKQPRNVVPLVLSVSVLLLVIIIGAVAYTYIGRSSQNASTPIMEVSDNEQPAQAEVGNDPTNSHRTQLERGSLDQELLEQILYKEFESSDPIYLSAFEFETRTVGNLTMEIPTSNHPENVLKTSNFDNSTLAGIQLINEYYGVQRVLYLNTQSDYYEPIYSKVLAKSEGQNYSTSYASLAGFLTIDQITEPGVQSVADYTGLENTLFSEAWCAEQYEDGYIYTPFENTIYNTNDSGIIVYKYVHPICVSSNGGPLPTNQYLVEKDNQVYVIDTTQNPFPQSVIDKMLQSIE